MQFLYPGFLWALAALAIPVIIHLFYFRRFKKVYFTNVRFLREVKEETSARQRIRNWLVLLMRLLTVAFLVLAFAQPFIPLDENTRQGIKAVSLYVDNSFSMDALSRDVSLLELAKRRAAEIVRVHSAEDRFQILTNDFEGRHQRLVSKEDALTFIEEIGSSPTVRTLSQVLARQQQVLQQAPGEVRVAYLISDFQRSITDLESWKDTTFEVNLVPLDAVQERNIALDSVWFEAPVQMVGQTQNLLVRVGNRSHDDVENIRLSLEMDGEEKPVGVLSIPAQGSVVDTVRLRIRHTGWHVGVMKVTDFPVQFDDHYHLAFHVAEKIRVLAINELQPNPFLDAAVRGLENFELVNLQSRNLDYSTFKDYHLIVCNELKAFSSGLAFELKNYVEGGGNLLIFPAPDAELDSYNNLLRSLQANEFQTFETQPRQVSDINTEEFVFRDVYENRTAPLKLPATNGNFRLGRLGSRPEERLLTYRDGSTFLAKYVLGKGNFYLCSAPLSETYSNLVRQGEVFVPMLFKMALSANRERRIAYTIGRDEVLSADLSNPGTEKVFRLRGPGGEFIPEQRFVGARVLLGLNHQIRQAGVYDLLYEDDSPLYKFAFNYDRAESDLSHYNAEGLRTLLGDAMKVIDVDARASFSQVIEERSQGIVLWRLCLWLALAFLALEVLLLRVWKV